MISRISLLVLGIILHLNVYAQKDLSTESSVQEVTKPLFSTSWNLAELYGTSTLQPGAKQAYLTFQRGDFGYNRMSGFTGCNYVSGRINLAGENGIIFHPSLITNDNCAGGTLEAPLMEALLNADKWSEKNGQLLLHRKGKVIAKWNPSTAYNANLNGMWQLVYLGGLPAPFAEIFPDSICPKIIFSEKQPVATGYAGCHEYTTPFLINQHSLVFTETTPCDTACVKEENIFLKSLGSVNAFYFKDEKTLVFVNNGQPIMAFNRRKQVQGATTAGTN